MAQATPPAGTTQKAKPAEQMNQTTDQADQPASPQMGADVPPPATRQQGAIFTDWASI